MGFAGGGDGDCVRGEDGGDVCCGGGVQDAGEGGGSAGDAHEHQRACGAHRSQHRQGKEGQNPSPRDFIVFNSIFLVFAAALGC